MIAYEYPAQGYSPECDWMRYILVLIMALLIPTAAIAKGECKDDKQKFCKGLAKAELKACFKEHEAELSAACKSAQAAKAEAKGAKKAGKKDETKPGSDSNKIDQPEGQNAPSDKPRPN
jgi:hypothetical protein